MHIRFTRHGLQFLGMSYVCPEMSVKRQKKRGGGDESLARRAGIRIILTNVGTALAARSSRSDRLSQIAKTRAQHISKLWPASRVCEVYVVLK